MRKMTMKWTMMNINRVRGWRACIHKWSTQLATRRGVAFKTIPRLTTLTVLVSITPPCVNFCKFRLPSISSVPLVSFLSRPDPRNIYYLADFCKTSGAFSFDTLSSQMFVWQFLGSFEKLSWSQVLAVNNFVLLCRDRLRFGLSPLTLHCIQVTSHTSSY